MLSPENRGARPRVPPRAPDCVWVTDAEEMRGIAHPRWGIVRAVQKLLVSFARVPMKIPWRRSAGANLWWAPTLPAPLRPPLVAEKTGIAWASAIHMPTGDFSAYDPPLIPGFPGSPRRFAFSAPSFGDRSVARQLGGCDLWQGRPSPAARDRPAPRHRRQPAHGRTLAVATPGDVFRTASRQAARLARADNRHRLSLVRSAWQRRLPAGPRRNS